MTASPRSWLPSPLGGGLDTDLLFFARTSDGWIIADAVSNFDLIQAAATPTT